MRLNRTQFFLILFTILIGPFIAYKIYWLHHSIHTTGVVYFIGHTLELQGGISTHRVVIFKTSRGSITFNTGMYDPAKPGDAVPVLYQKDDPADAREDSLDRIWGDTLVYSLLPLLVLSVIFLTPDSLNPLIPKGSTILLGKKPFVRILPKSF